jgi:3-oxoacyl-(acyl-carrier-protein) synthase
VEVRLPQPLAVITGTGVVAPSGVAPIEPLALPDGRPVPPFGCPIQNFDVRKHLPSIISYVDRCSALVLVAVKLALESAKVLRPVGSGRWAVSSDQGQPPSADRIPPTALWGLAYSSAWGCLDSMELFFAKVAAGQTKFAPPLVFSHSYVNTPSSLACIEFGLAGPGATFSQGASGAIVALGWARDRLVRTAGSECAGFAAAASDSLSKALRRHYAAAGELSADGRLAPLDPASAGTVLGEAGAALTIELEASARARGARPLAAILGWGSAMGLDPRKALVQAVKVALAEAAVSPKAESLPAVALAKAGRKPKALRRCSGP